MNAGIMTVDDALILGPQGSTRVAGIRSRLEDQGVNVIAGGGFGDAPIPRRFIYVHNADGAPEPATFLSESLPIIEAMMGGAGGSVVIVVSHDLLGEASRPEAAGASAGLVAVARSLALKYASSAVTVNVVAAPPTDPAEPGRRALLSRGVDESAIADAIVFLSDARSSYITGQLLFVCAGSTLLSSLSV